VSPARRVILIAGLAGVGTLAAGWQAESKGQQNVEESPRPPSGPHVSGQYVGGSTAPDADSSATTSRLQKTEAALDDMIRGVAKRLGKDPQKILTGLDSDGASADVSVAVLRRAQALKVLLQSLK